MKIIVVGAGISGVACGRALSAGGAEVVVLDRGRKPGGRLGLRRYPDARGGRPVDVGGSYFTVSDPAFEAVVEGWRSRGLARPWTDTFASVDDGDVSSKTGPMRWAAPGGLRGLVEDLADGLDLRSGVTVQDVYRAGSEWLAETVEETFRADRVVFAMPDPQARRLLSDGPERDAFGLDFEPVLVLTAIWPERRWPDRDGWFVNGDDVLAWVADDGLRRGDGAPVLVAHSTSAFAATRLDHPGAAAPELVSRLLGMPGFGDVGEPGLTDVQRWSFARPAEPRDRPFLLTDSGLGACGDGWAAKPSVEAAFVSGRRLATAILERG